MSVGSYRGDRTPDARGLMARLGNRDERWINLQYVPCKSGLRSREAGHLSALKRPRLRHIQDLMPVTGPY